MRLLNYVLLVTCGTFFCCKSVFAATSTCDPGYYGGFSWGPRCWGCPAGCFCIGGTQPAAFYGNSGWCERTGNASRGWDMYAFSKDGTGTPEHISSGEEGAKIEQDNVKIIGLWQAGGLRRCPRDYPKSKPNSTSESDCYADVAGKQVYDISKKCAPGYYLPLQENECAWCKDDGRSYCPGGTFHTSLSSDSGISECKSGEKPNATKTACEEEIVQCNSDEIFTSNGKGCTKCGVGTYPNASQTECVGASAQSVQPGYYLPKGAGSKQKQCSESTYYCPGGDYVESGEDQGKFKCPKNTTANQKRTACVARVPKNNLKTGPNPNTPTEFQCWMNVTDIEKYKLCVIANPYYK